MSSRSPRRPSWLIRFRQHLSSLVGRTSRLRRGMQGHSVFLLLLLTLLVGPNGALTSLSELGTFGHVVPSTAAALTPMTQDRALANQAHAWGHASGTQETLAQYLATAPHTAPKGAIIPRQVVTPQPSATGSVTLSATTTTVLTTSDHRFTITIPTGALTSSDLAAVGGPLTLRVTELAGPVGGGASGHMSLGTYRIELVGPQGRVVNRPFRMPLTLALLYTPEEAGAFINYGVRLHLEPDMPRGTNGIVTPGTGVSASPSPFEDDPTRLAASSNTLLAQTTLTPLTASGALVATFNTSAPQATWPTVQAFQTNLNSGSLTYNYPLILPPAPGGFLPNLSLSYSSATVNEDHGVQTDAPWVGEGWALDLGAISWSQEDENSGCQQHFGNYTVPCSSHNWQNIWNISAAGISSTLVPQNVNWATGPNSAGYTQTSAPVEWYTAPESHARVWMINCTTKDLQNNNWTHPCWRVWLPSGEMLEFGATNDSVEYYLDASHNKYIYSWKVDALFDTHGNQIHASYQQYTAAYSSTDSTPYVRDAELANVSYDSPTCQNTSTICPTTGSAPNLWQPLVQVVFDQSVKPTRLTGGDSACQTWSSTTARCDMATDYSGGLAGPQVTTLGVLDAIEVQVRPSGTGGWNLLRAYALSYEQSAKISGHIDSISGEYENMAGYLDLTRIQEFGDDWTGDSTNTGTSWPAMQFSYSGSKRSQLNCTTNTGSFPCTDTSSLQERYVDPVYQSSLSPAGYSQCIVWVNYNGCYTYSYSETFSQRYLSEVDNGMGWQETFSWQEGHMNVAGVPSGHSITSPFGCTASNLNAFPCWEADEQHWSRILLTATDSKVQRTTNGGPTITVDDHHAYTYTMTAVQAGNTWCVSGACTAVWDWGNVNDGDYLDYYNSQFRGFSQVHVVEQEIDTGGGSCTTTCTISVEDHYYITTQGWGVWNQSEVTNTTGVGCWNKEGTQYLCPSSPSWASTNMPAGRETEVDEYASDGSTLLQKTLNSYTLNCAPAGNPSTPVPSWDSDGKWWTINPGVNNTHLLVTELDQDNPTVVCDPQLTQQQTISVDGGSVSGAPTKTVTYSYDTNQSYSGSHDYGNLTVTDTTASNGGSVGGGGHDIVQTTDYTVNDNISTTATSATGTYIVDTPYQKATRSGSATGTIQALTQDYYDGNTSLTAAPTRGDVTQESVAYSGSGPYNYLTTKYGYDSYGNLVGILQPSGQTGCTVGSTSYSSCAIYDTSSYTAHVTQVTNALGQHSLTRAYGSGASFGYGEWTQSDTDANSQATTYQYDKLGRLTGITRPGEGTGLLTTQYAYSTSACPATGPSIPCSELDTIQRYDSSTTVTTRTFYDGYGKAAETRTPADGSNDVVQYTTYDAREEKVFTSRAYYVATGTGYSAPDGTQLGSSAVYDALGRTIQTTDPAGATTTTSYLQLTGPNGVVYSGAQVIDADQHQTATLADALGRQRFAETFTGTGPYTLYAAPSYAYDFQGNLTMIAHPDGTHTTSYTYDLAGRKTGMSDPDLGNITYALDADGNIIQQTDARGQTVYMGYDALDRPLWRNTTNSPTGAYVTYTYDGTVPSGVNCGAPIANPVGHLTTEQALSGPGNSFSYTACYSYDGRGQETYVYNTINTTAVTGQTSFSYNDAGMPTQVIYPNGDKEQYTYSAQERLTTITGYNSTTGQSQLLVSGITYNGTAGAAGQPDSYTLGGTNSACSAANSSIACVTLGYDADLRFGSASFSHPTTSTPITYYQLNLRYNAVGNVITANATLPAAGGQNGGRDNQVFCYDELNRLTTTVSSSVGGVACAHIISGGTGSTLQAALYSATYQYDTSNRLAQSTLTGALSSAPQGSYAYDSTHYHAVDAIGSSGYEAQYDASGNMTCRTVTSTQVCTSGSQTGAKLTYDVEGRLIEWDSADGTTKVTYGYTGEGARFIQQVATNGQTTSTTSYLPNEEVVAVPGQSAAVTTYFSYNGKLIAEDQAGHWYYLLTDNLGSVDVVADDTGVIAAELFGPYGQVRWAGGTMPTTYGYTGQHSDVTTGLDYYNARYYDPAAGQFISADTVLSGKGMSPAGLNRFSYVADDPETLTDPTGHRYFCGDCGGGSGGGNPPPPPPSCPIGVERCGGGGGGHGGSGGGSCKTGANCDMGNGGNNDSGWHPCGSGVSYCPTGNEDGNNAILSLDGYITNQITGQGAAGVAQLIAYLQGILGGYLSTYIDSIFNQQVAQIWSAGGGGSLAAGLITGAIGFLACGLCGLNIGATVAGAGTAVTGVYSSIVTSQDKANAENQMSGEIEETITALENFEIKIENGDLPPDTVITVNEQDFEQGDSPYPQIQLAAVIVGPNSPPEAGGVETDYSNY
jgi:RHS repeat-associated protein